MSNIITGTDNNDILQGTSGSDAIFAHAGNDTLYGNDGDDFLIGGAGQDILNGGYGFDVAQYSDSASAVSVNLDTKTGTGDAAGDQFISIEGLFGTNYNDELTSSISGSKLSGWQGNDIYYINGVGVQVSEGPEAQLGTADEVRTT